MTRILDDLTDAQREAVTHRDGPMLVVAGAGSGKTRVVTRRIAHLIDQGVRPWQILAVTFTNKAAREMHDRVERLVGPVPALVTTFHSACARWLRRDVERLDCGRDRRYSIYDDDDQIAVIRACLKDLDLDEKRFAPRGLSAAISRSKTEMRTYEEVLADAHGPRQEVVAEVYQAYEKRLRGANAVDFDDLLWLTLRMLTSDPELLAGYQQRYRYLLVDEYQDTNRVQYLLMKALAGQSRNLHATGDPDQSIYSWRGADYRNIMDFESDYPGTRVVFLEKNYRSTARILNVANELISHNAHRYEKRLVTDAAQGERPAFFCAADDRTEAAWVVREVRRLERAGTPLDEIAVFYRVNALSRTFEEVLIRESVPYTIVGGVRFYERKEIKDVLAYLKAVANPRDNAAFRRLAGAPPRGVGVKTLDALEALAAQRGAGMMETLVAEDFGEAWTGRYTKGLKALRALCRALAALPRAPVRAFVEAVLEHAGLKDHYRDPDDIRSEDRVENIEGLVNRAAEFDAERPDADLAAFLEDVALVTDVDEWNSESRQITLMSMHAAKGLEFRAVFVAGLEEGLLPHRNSMDTDAEREEERRLLYVAMTRAKERLYLSAAKQRLQWGEITMSLPSSFLDELPAEEVECLPGEDEVFAPEGLVPSMGRPGGYYGRRAPVRSGRRRKLGAGQWRRRTFEDEDAWDDLDPGLEPEDEIQEHPDDDVG